MKFWADKKTGAESQRPTKAQPASVRDFLDYLDGCRKDLQRREMREKLNTEVHRLVALVREFYDRSAAEQQSPDKRQNVSKRP